MGIKNQKSLPNSNMRYTPAPMHTYACLAVTSSRPLSLQSVASHYASLPDLFLVSLKCRPPNCNSQLSCKYRPILNTARHERVVDVESDQNQVFQQVQYDLAYRCFHSATLLGGTLLFFVLLCVDKVPCFLLCHKFYDLRISFRDDIAPAEPMVNSHITENDSLAL